MSDFVHDQALTALSPAEARLAALLGCPKLIALGCIAGLTALGWLAVGLLSARAPFGWQALCEPARADGAGAFAIGIAMWTAMVLAMMLPTAGPMILTYAEIADTAARKREPVVSPLVLAAGYVAVWFGFALVASSLQWALAGAGWPAEAGTSRLVSAMLFVGAGLYQFAPLKQACLSACQRPFPFFFRNWTTEPAGVLRLGVRQGLYCLGCCWAMMTLMFATGFMNVVWMAAFGALMTIEKISTTPRFSKALGVVFIAAGVALAGSSVA